MTVPVLTLEAFQALLDRYGGELSSWPAPDAVAATKLLEANSEARVMLEHARALDAALANSPKAPAGLADRIVAAALKGK
jgi:hypothetical protein